MPSLVVRCALSVLFTTMFIEAEKHMSGRRQPKGNKLIGRLERKSVFELSLDSKALALREYANSVYQAIYQAEINTFSA